MTKVQQIKIFVINLKRSIDRRKRMEALLNNLGLTYELVEAVYGKELEKSQIDEINSNASKFKKQWGREMTLGEIGCAISHAKCYEKIVKENIPYSIILEDDIFFLYPDVFKSFCLNPHLFSPPFEMIFLGFSNILIPHNDPYPQLRKNIMRIGKKIRFPDATEPIFIGLPASFCWSATCYFVANNGARKMLEQVLPIRAPADAMTGNAEKYGIYTGVASKAIAWSIPESLSIEGSDVGQRKIVHTSALSRYFRKIKIEKTKTFLTLRKYIYYIQSYLAKYHILPYQKYDL